MLKIPVLLIAGILFASGAASPGQESVLYRFATHSDGILPRAGVIFDNAGNIFGTTFNGGIGRVSEGSVFEARPPARRGGAWSESILHSFLNLQGGQYPWTGLVGDKHGNLYGTTWLGGGGLCSVETCGVVFRLSPPPFDGAAWTYIILHSFSGLDGGGPEAGSMVRDDAGDLFGTTSVGGTGQCFMGGGCGVVFEVYPVGNVWFERVLYNFLPNSEGYGGTTGDLVRDRAGNLFGTTVQDGGTGTVFELSRPVHGQTWIYKVLHTFRNLNDGIWPLSGLAFDSRGNLYGTTQLGAHSGCYGSGCGTVFRLSPTGHGTWTHTTLFKFTGTGDGSMPQYDLTLDAAGDIYGVASEGGTGAGCIGLGCGVVFRLRASAHTPWAETVLHTFRNGGDGYVPVGMLTFGKDGRLYGATNGGGNSACNDGGFGCGTIFSISP